MHQELLAILKRSPATVRQITSAVDSSESRVRAHLIQLLNTGAILRTEQRYSERGGTVHIYTINTTPPVAKMKATRALLRPKKLYHRYLPNVWGDLAPT